MQSERVSLTTSDEIHLVGTYRTPEHPRSAAILLHMMPATKESWDAFSTELENAGYASIAIDLRGHGESTMNGTLDYRTFSNAQHEASIHDVEAAFAFLQQKGFADSSIIVVGASIGANFAMQFVSAHSGIPLAIALSPGLDYHGVRTSEAATHLADAQRIVIVASDDDPESAVDSKKLHDLNPSQTTLIEKHTIGHGTTMLTKDPTLTKTLIDLILIP